MGLEPRLDFILNISNNTHQLKAKLLIPLTPIMTNAKRDEVAKKVPKMVTVKGIDGNTFLRKFITQMDESQTRILNHFKEEASAEFKYELPQNDEALKESFNIWVNHGIEHIRHENLEMKIRTVESEYSNFYEQFKRKMDIVDEITHFIGGITVLLNIKCDKLIRSKDQKHAINIFDELGSVSTILSEQQLLLRQNLEQLKEILKQYNENRKIWVEFLIGMRTSLNSTRIPLKRKEGLCNLCGLRHGAIAWFRMD